ncbi:hypothetical protein GCM10025868_16710 [Angustibacter aerolatus]|uniref:PseI/NeuA/B-like domain-containing protein n=1 Tax=Angustibacter aerolatus TaxID=1162965 RepID=A0ABQ6JI32_9ACTN|nr:hypothetical protein GCM10025868_16710 [Angustibacter aerolatus]
MKFQKRTPEIAVPEHQKAQRRQTPWGEMSYLEYKHRVEFGQAEYEKIAAHAADRGIAWFASPWDVPSVDFLNSMDVPVHKVASASITDLEPAARRARQRPPGAAVDRHVGACRRSTSPSKRSAPSAW